MAKLAINEYPDPRLRTRAVPVAEVDAGIRALIDDMLETMYAARGVGLAATQVNVHKRVLVTDVSEERNRPLAFVNPEVIEREVSIEAEENAPTTWRRIRGSFRSMTSPIATVAV